MRIALVVLALAACSKPSSHRPTVDEIGKRLPGTCEEVSGLHMCRSDTIDVTVARDKKDKSADPHVEFVTITIRTPTGEAAVAMLEPILDGFVPPGILDGIRNGLSGSTAHAFKPGAHLLIDNMLLSAGTATFGDLPTMYMVELWYR